MFLLSALAFAPMPSLSCERFPQVYETMLLKYPYAWTSYRGLNKLKILLQQVWGVTQDVAFITCFQAVMVLI